MRATGMCLLILALAACNRGAEAPSTDGASRATPASATLAAAAPPSTPAPAASAAAKDDYAGKPYAEVRGMLLAKGWLPLRTPACRTNVGGDAPVCNALPETDSCSGDGHCLMRFAHPSTARTLTLHTYGDIDRWNAPGEEADVAVRSSEAGVAKAAPGTACPAGDFEGVLRHFAANAPARAALSRPLVRASELHSDADGDRLVPVVYAASDYPGFALTFDGRAFHHVDASGRTDPAPLPVEIVGGEAGDMIVRYRYGASEGRAFRFERAGDCWRLAEEMPPPLD